MSENKRGTAGPRGDCALLTAILLNNLNFAEQLIPAPEMTPSVSNLIRIPDVNKRASYLINVN